jgi:hypothetical protein
MNAKTFSLSALTAIVATLVAAPVTAAEKADKPQSAAVAAPALTPAAAEQRAYAVVRSRLTALKACYLNGSRGGESVSGKAVVSFTIGVDGKATDIKVEAPALEGTGVAACVAAAVARWGFQRQASAQVSFPVLFVQS